MKLQTCSETISFAKKLENASSEFYQHLSERYTKERDVFLSFVKENHRYVVQVERAYYSVITDAIESCFAFDVDPNAYTFETQLPDSASRADALAKALEIEDKIVKFYSDAAEHASSLMADVPRNFVMIAKKRKKRIEQVKSLSQESEVYA
jgi:rubrerythrin